MLLTDPPGFSVQEGAEGATSKDYQEEEEEAKAPSSGISNGLSREVFFTLDLETKMPGLDLPCSCKGGVEVLAGKQGRS